MASKHNVQFTVEIPIDLDAADREELGDLIIEHIRARTLDGRGIDEGGWKGKAGQYTKAYKAASGKSEPVDLELTGEMLDGLNILTHDVGYIDIGYSAGDSLAEKVEGNTTGSYGRSPNSSKARNFLGIDGKILDEFVEGLRDERISEEEFAIEESDAEIQATVDSILAEQGF